MGTIKSTGDLTGWVINGVTMGTPSRDPDTGENLWDHEDLPEVVMEPPVGAAEHKDITSA